MVQDPGRHVTKVGRERVAPEVLQAITLDDIAVGINKLLELTQRQIPEGLAPFIHLDTSNPVTTERREIGLQPPWFSLEIFNDGVDDLYVWINEGTWRPIMLRSDDPPLRVDYDLPIIHRVYLQALTSSTPVRLIGTR